MTRLVAYVRASTAKQELSPEAQATRLRDWSLARQIDLRGPMYDPDCSGYFVHPMDRPGFKDVVLTLETGAAEGMVATGLDRIARRARWVDEIVELFEKKGWLLVVTDMTLDESTAAGRLGRAVKADVDQFYRDVISENTKRALAQIRKQGRAISRYTPFGWRTADGDPQVSKGDRRPLIEHTEELAALGRIVALRAKGLGARRIARALTVQGVRNPRTGSWWNRRAVERALATAERA